MSLYTRKKGQYVEMSREQVRKLRRTEQVVALQKAAKSNASALRALAAWLYVINARSMKLAPEDIEITSMPARDILLKRADAVDKAIQALKER